jgi:hypothetical protein
MDELEYVRKKRDGVCLWGLFKKDGCSGGLDAHHIITRGAGGPDDRKNLISLCRKHHMEAQEYRIKPEELRAVLIKMYGYKY